MPIPVQPTDVPLRCPRCWFPGQFVPYAALTWRCSRCEWPFTLGAPSLASPPAVPASTVAAANTTGTAVKVTISGGTSVTTVTVTGASGLGGSGDGTYYVPAGGTIAVTYSGAPTWAWALPAINAGVSAGGTSLPFATPAGSAFSQGQVLIVDPSGTSDVVVVNGTPTATSVPVNALNYTHLTGVTVTVAQLTSALNSVENVPVTAY